LRKEQYIHGDLAAIKRKKDELEEKRKLQEIFDKWRKNKVKKIRISSVILNDGSMKPQNSFMLENLRYVGEINDRPIVSGNIFRYNPWQGKIRCSQMADDSDRVINTNTVYCVIESNDRCVISLEKTNETSFYWELGSMISLKTKGRQKIAEFVFVGG
jgi:hypothetical protein